MKTRYIVVLILIFTLLTSSVVFAQGDDEFYFSEWEEVLIGPFAALMIPEEFHDGIFYNPFSEIEEESSDNVLQERLPRWVTNVDQLRYLLFFSEYEDIQVSLAILSPELEISTHEYLRSGEFFDEHNIPVDNRLTLGVASVGYSYVSYLYENDEDTYTYLYMYLLYPGMDRVLNIIVSAPSLTWAEDHELIRQIAGTFHTQGLYIDSESWRDIEILPFLHGIDGEIIPIN